MIFLLFQFQVSFPSDLPSIARLSSFPQKILRLTLHSPPSLCLPSMQEINDAFKELRSVIPELPEESEERSDEYSDNASSSSKLTKITTLRLAVNYIAALSDILKHTDPPSPHSPTADSTTSGPSATLQTDPLPALPLDLDLEPLNTGDFPLSTDGSRDVAQLLFDSAFLRPTRSRPGSGSSFDLNSYHSPATTETDSIESFAGSAGWDFGSTEGSLADVCENFDLMLEDGDRPF